MKPSPQAAFLGLSFVLSVALHAGPPAVVKADRTNVRAKPAFDAEVLATLKQGDTVETLGEVAGTGVDGSSSRAWTKIALPDQVPVWVYGPLVDARAKTVKGAVLNFRAGPGNNYSELGQLTQGTTVTVIRELDGWLQIEPPAGSVAFVASRLIGPANATAPIAAAAEKVPVADPQPTAAAVVKQALSIPPQAEPTPTGTSPRPVAEQARTAPPEPAPTPRKTPRRSVAKTVPLAPAAPSPAPATIQPQPTAIIEPVPATSSTDKPVAAVAGDTAPRQVMREGVVGQSWNIQSPGYVELNSSRKEGTLDYLISGSPDLDLTKWRGQWVFVTGEEWRDSRWKTPLMKVKSIRSAE